MRALAMQLWKDARMHRATFLGYVLLVAIAAPATTLLLAREHVESGQLVNAFLLVSLLAAACTVTCELVPEEGAAGTLAFLARLPRGLALAFCSKVLVVPLALLAFGAVGLVCAHVSWVLLCGKPWLEPLPIDLLKSWPILWQALGLGLWVFAFSSWMPRGLLAVPAVAVLALPYLAASWLATGRQTWDRTFDHVARSTIMTHVWLAPVLALIVAWVSFVLGRRHGGGVKRSWKLGSLAALLVWIPLWGWLTWLVHEWHTPRPGRDGIVRAVLGEGGRLAFVTTARGMYSTECWPMLSSIVDLDTGEIRTHGDADHPFESPNALKNLNMVYGGAFDVILQQSDKEWWQCLDGRTGKAIGATPTDGSFPGLRDRTRATVRANTPLRLPDGRRVWYFDRQLEVELGEGTHETWHWEARLPPFSSCGFGVRVFVAGSRCGIYDFTFTEHPREFDSCYVLGRYWLARRLDQAGRHSLGWKLLDPDTGETREVRAEGTIVTMLDDASLLVRSDESEPPRAWRVDPFSGEREELALPPELVPKFEPRRHWAWLQDAEILSPARGLDERRIFFVQPRAACGSRCLVTLPQGARTFTPPIPCARLVGCVDATHAITIGPDERTLERVDLDSGARVQVFPR